MKPYPKYKDSGVEWIGEIPEGWEVFPIKRIVSTPVTDGPHETPEILLDGIPFISAEAIKNDQIDFSKKRGYISLENHEKYSNKYKPCRGDIYLVKSGATTGNIATVETDDEFNIWSPLAAIRPNHQKAITRFVFHFLKSKNFFQSVELGWSFGTQQNIGMGVIENLPIVIPPVDEQTVIVAYLDSKTVELDGLISRKERLIELYEEEKAAVINQAVTKGLDPAAPMKQSGIDWLGDIPEHWEVKKLKYLTAVLKDGTHGSFTRVINGYRLLSVRNIKGDSFDFLDDDSKISETDFLAITKPFKVSENDIQLAIVGATLGKVAIVPKSDEEFATQRSVATIRSDPKVMETKFQFYFFKGDFFQCYLWINAGFSAQPGVYLGTLENCHITVPSLIEQAAIVQHIETECSRLDTIIDKFHKQIDLLKEYRTTLISEVVTGKIDVRDEVAQ